VKDLLLACIVTLVIVSIYGFVRGDRMRLTALDEKRPTRFYLVVSVPDLTAKYAVLLVQGCAAQVTEHGTFCMEDGWFADSRREFRADQRQYDIPFPPPRGTVKFTAVAFDRDAKVITSNQLTLMRGF
jgi:hypothetical protein